MSKRQIPVPQHLSCHLISDLHNWISITKRLSSQALQYSKPDMNNKPYFKDLSLQTRLTFKK
jgi:hypothetical protein